MVSNLTSDINFRIGWLEEVISLSTMFESRWIIGVYLFPESNEEVGFGDLNNCIGNHSFLELVGAGDSKMPTVVIATIVQATLVQHI